MKRIVVMILAICMMLSLSGCIKEEIAEEEAVASGETALAVDAEVYITDIDYPGDIETGIIDTSKIAAIFNESNEKYLWYKVNTEVIEKECGLYALGEEAFKTRMEDKAIEDEINSYSDLEVRREDLSTIEANAVSIFDGYLTHGDVKNYKGYFAAPFTAFDGAVVAGAEFTPDEYFKENGLDLYFRNAELKQIVCSDILIRSQWLVTARVKATVDCYENSGIFKDIAWIPEEGMEKDIEFAVTYMSFYTKESDLHEVQVYDICVITED